MIKINKGKIIIDGDYRTVLSEVCTLLDEITSNKKLFTEDEDIEQILMSILRKKSDDEIDKLIKETKEMNKNFNKFEKILKEYIND